MEPEKPIPPDTTSAEEYFDWNDKQRRRHRVMTWGEYALWSRSGDAFDNPSNSNCFRGGLTIVLDGRAVMYGGFIDKTSND